MKRIIIPVVLIIGIIIIGIFAFDKYMERKVKKIIDDFAKSGEDIQYEDVDFSLIDRNIRIKKLFIHNEGDTFLVEEVIVYRYEDLFNFVILMKDLKMVEGPRKEQYIKALNFFKELDYKDTRFDLYIDMEVNKKENKASIKSFKLIVHPAFSLEFFADIGNFDPSFWKKIFGKKELTEEEVIEAMSEFGSLKLFRIGFSYENRDFRDRFIKYLAKDEGLTPEEFKAKIKKSLDETISKTDSPSHRKVLSDIKYFIEKGKFIKISIEPVKPMKFQDIALYTAFALEQGKRNPGTTLLNLFKVESEVF